MPQGKSFWLQELTWKDYSLAAAKGLLIVAAIAGLFYDSLLWAPVLSPLGVFYGRREIRQCLRRKQQEFERQFQDALQSLAAELNVGYSLENAIGEVQRDLQALYTRQSVVRREFAYMARQLRLNVTAEQAWRDLADRVGLPEVDSFVTVFIQAKRSGGDSIRIIRNAIRQLAEKADVKREVETVIAARRLEFQVMSVIPFGIVGYLRVSFPDFMRVLYGNAAGAVFMSACLGLYLLAWRLGRGIVEIEV